MEIIWTQTALKQYQKAVAYTRDEYGSKVAENFKKGVLKTIRPLEDHPRKGPTEPLLQHKKHEYRFLIFLRYKILYRVTSEKVFIIRFFHTSQNPDKLIF
jgi:toxin ParE1/3/4